MIFLFDFTLFVIDIHHIMLISLFPTPFDHFHFHLTLGLDPALILTLRHILTIVIICITFFLFTHASLSLDDDRHIQFLIGNAIVTQQLS